MSEPQRLPGDLLGVNLAARWQSCDDSLRALARGLERELTPLLNARELPIPSRKARLTRAGGRCVVDGSLLSFDAWQPHDHVCPTCGTVYRGIEHDDWWAMSAQLWCAERAVHAAVLGEMWQRADLTQLASEILAAFGERYATYPNEDNALGPTRPFFSTYLESVWLLNTCLAAQVLRNSRKSLSTVDTFCDTVVEPSRLLIASFPEGRSNRQTWHTAAQLAACTLLNDTERVSALIDGPTGVHTLLRNGLLDDGSWYEGENYHLFAHRGLWYGVCVLEAMGVMLSPPLTDRFNAGFRTPLLGILPDGTFPSRRDSRYGVSVHQWRFAEWCELGLARHDHPTLRTWLHRLYNSGHTLAATDREHSTADIERDAPPSALCRHDLGWRTLLCARATAWRAPEVIADESVVLEAQGLSVIRRDAGRIYVALEGGNTGGGHGHPDRLALTIQDGDARVLEDPGAGSYVERALHWYRSTLAHNAPLVNGRSQIPVSTTLRAFESRDRIAWMQAKAEGISPDVCAVRTVIISELHIVDHVEWWSPRSVTFDLPIHFQASESGEHQWRSTTPGGAGGLEDGFDFLMDAESCDLSEQQLLQFQGTVETQVRFWCAAGTDATLFRAVAPGPPRMSPRQFHWIRQVAAVGWVASVWALRDSLASVSIKKQPNDALMVRVHDRSGLRRSYQAQAPAWHVTHEDTHGVHAIKLGGLRASAAQNPDPPRVDPTPRTTVDLCHQPMHVILGKAHYRGSETDWDGAGQPSAEVRVEANADALFVFVTVYTDDITAPAADEENPLDNERADVDADGIQCYVGPIDRAEWSAAWLLVPDVQTGEVRVTPLTPQHVSVVAHWTRIEPGYTLTLQIPRRLLPEGREREIRFDLLVNERPAHRQRRRSQLVLSGSDGESVYLRGDRHEPLRAWRLVLPPLPETDPSFDLQS